MFLSFSNTSGKRCKSKFDQPKKEGAASSAQRNCMEEVRRGRRGMMVAAGNGGRPIIPRSNISLGRKEEKPFPNSRNISKKLEKEQPNSLKSSKL